MTPLVTSCWKFLPLCVDCAGGWARAAQEALQLCAQRIDTARRGAMVALWWQRLAVALQQEGFRILRTKVAAALGAPL